MKRKRMGWDGMVILYHFTSLFSSDLVDRSLRTSKWKRRRCLPWTYTIWYLKGRIKTPCYVLVVQLIFSDTEMFNVPSHIDTMDDSICVFFKMVVNCFRLHLEMVMAWSTFIYPNRLFTGGRWTGVLLKGHFLFVILVPTWLNQFDSLLESWWRLYPYAQEFPQELNQLGWQRVKINLDMIRVW